MSQSRVNERIPHHVAADLARFRRVVLAVSGGLDSMALLHAALETTPRERLIVATFDHATGDHAQRAVEFVRQVARRVGVRFVSARAADAPETEAGWRAARWQFLRRVAEEAEATVATAHTESDQLETIVMRLMRDAGTRGLAALYADSPISRPLLPFARTDVAAYASAAGVTWIEDPTNGSMTFLRNRVRRDLLPALLSARSSLATDLLDLSRQAASARRDLDAIARSLLLRDAESGAFCVASTSLADYDSNTLAMLWPSLAAVAGITLDRRGTLRLARFTKSGTDRSGSRIQLSGGFEVLKHRGSLVLRRSLRREARNSVPLVGETLFGSWRFGIAATQRGEIGAEPLWWADLPGDSPLTVRHWQNGDRMRYRGSESRDTRRVARFFADAHIDAAERREWPVVVADDEIVWIPGVRRVDAVAARSGRPAVHYVCERSNR